jgi:hypothetical protein
MLSVAVHAYNPSTHREFEASLDYIERDSVSKKEEKKE